MTVNPPQYPVPRLSPPVDDKLALAHGFVEQCLEALAREGLPVLLALCADNVVYACPHIPGPPVSGREGIAALIGLMNQQFSSATYECVRSVLDGCIATLDFKCCHLNNDGTEYRYLQRCRIEVHGGLIHRVDGQLLEMNDGADGEPDSPQVPQPQPQPTDDILRVHVGDKQVWVKAEKIRYLQAAGKHTVVVATDVRGVIRSGLGAVVARLKAEDFWQIHRGTVVNVNRIHTSQRDAMGRLTLKLIDGPEKFNVSRSHDHLFVRKRK